MNEPVATLTCNRMELSTILVALNTVPVQGLNHMQNVMDLASKIREAMKTLPSESARPEGPAAE